MTDLTDFLLARIAEDEAVAEQWPADRVPVGAIDVHGRPIWAPRTRVFGECEAKRRILRQYEAWHLPGDNTQQTREALRWVLRYLALPYADHPDFDPEWKP